MKPLSEIPLKNDYMKRDLERTARLFNVPFKLPSKFPIPTTAPARAFYHLYDKDPALAKRLALALYCRVISRTTWTFRLPRTRSTLRDMRVSIRTR